MQEALVESIRIARRDHLLEISNSKKEENRMPRACCESFLEEGRSHKTTKFQYLRIYIYILFYFIFFLLEKRKHCKKKVFLISSLD